MTPLKFLLVAALFSLTSFRPAPAWSGEEKEEELLERILKENIIDFWYPSTQRR